LRAARELQDVAEDELPFAAGVRGTDDVLGSAEQALDDCKLRPGALFLDNLESKVFRDDGERLERPALERRVIVLRLLQGDEVPEGPGDLVALALEVAIGSRSGSEKGSEFAGNRRLFSEYDFHGCGFGWTSPRMVDTQLSVYNHPGRSIMAKKRRTYTPEFKAEAV